MRVLLVPISPDAALFAQQPFTRLAQGRVVWSEDGCRGEYAYPMALALVPETAPNGAVEGLLEALGGYGVPVSTTPLEEAVGDVARAVLAHQFMASRHQNDIDSMTI